MSEKLSANMASAVPDLYFFRDTHWLSEGVWFVQGILAAGRSLRAMQTCSFSWDGKKIPSDWVTHIPLAESDQRFSFLPRENLFTVRIKIPHSHHVTTVSGGYHVVDVIPSDEKDKTLRTFAVYDKAEYPQPLPPVSAIERVSGRGATEYNYVNNGRTDFLRFCSIAARYGVDVKDPSVRILDWGSGCGRLTRHFFELEDGSARVVGVDIDPDNIKWSQQNLAGGSFEVGPLEPPLAYSDGCFDLIIANSVFSHLKLDTARAWLKELRRVLRPGGVALLSFHGNFSLVAFCGRTPAFVDKVAQQGYNSDLRAPELDGLVGDDDYYRQTYMTDVFALDLFSRDFKLEDVQVGTVSRYQNVAVCR